MRRLDIFHGVLCLLVALAATSCKSDDGQECTPGTLDCECHVGECFGDLVCAAGVCVPDEIASSTDTGGEMGTTSSGDDVDTTTTSSSTSDTTTSSTETGGCAPGLTDCGGACVDLSSDIDNCGSCGKVCDMNIASEGGCVAGTCAPAYSECFAIPAPAQTCDQICGSMGKTCVYAGCNNGGTLWRYLAGPLCETNEAGTEGSPACSAIVSADNGIYTHARCCCQQP